MDARLYVIPGSHPSTAARLMLEMKGIPYERVDLMPVLSKAALRALRFPGVTVPALRLDGQRIQGSRAIARELDRIRPEPPLVPVDPEERVAVEDVERWADEDLQSLARRVSWSALRRDRASLASFAEGARLGVPIGLAVRTAGPIVALAVRFNRASDENARADLAALPGVLARIDDWIAAGTLGGDSPNVADLQVATSLRLLMCLDDVRPAIEGRPGGALAMRVVPEFPGRVPPVLPPTWLEPFRDSAPAAT